MEDIPEEMRILGNVRINDPVAMKLEIKNKVMAFAAEIGVNFEFRNRHELTMKIKKNGQLRVSRKDS